MRIEQRTSPGGVTWRTALVVLTLGYALVWALYAGKYQESSDGVKYDLSAEAFKRLLFTGDPGGLGDYARDRLGIGSGGTATMLASTAVTDERPVFFLYLATLKLADPAPVGLHLAVSLALLLASLVQMAHALDPPDKPLFVMVSGLLLSPYFVFQGFAYQPHVLQMAFACCAFNQYVRGRTGLAFACMTLSFLSHGLSLILLGCLGLFLLVDRPLDWRACARAFLGVLGAWLAVELVLQLAFWKDDAGVMPHVTFFEQFFLKSSRLHGEFARGPGVASTLKSLAVLTPLGLAGLFLARKRAELALAVLPLVLFGLATKGAMSGDVRVLTPMLLMGHCVFVARALEARSAALKAVCAGAACVALALSVAYYAEVARCVDISRDEGAPAAIAPESTGASAWLHWNLRRYHPVAAEASRAYGLRPVNRLELPGIPDPNLVHIGQLFILLSKVLPPERLSLLGSLNPSPPVYGLFERGVADAR